MLLREQGPRKMHEPGVPKMLELIETGSKISKADFEAKLPELRVTLLNLQFELMNADFPVILVVAGDDRRGANRVVDRIHEWMDSRYIDTQAYGKPSDEELERPRFWRYWKNLPPKGRIGLFGGAWSLNAIVDRLEGELGRKQYKQRLHHINQFERDLAADGALILKFWIHLTKKELKKRLKESKKDPESGWWVDDVDWAIYENHKEVFPPIEQLLETTSTSYAEWKIIDGTDGRFRDMTVADSIAAAIRRRLDEGPSQVPSAANSVSAPANASIPDKLAEVNLEKSLDKETYQQDLSRYQRKIHKLMHKVWDKKKSIVMAFEGWDAGGKGGAIRRVTGALPAMSYKVVPVAAPTQEELARHYLWRFWRHLPRAGRMLIFDRSWYGRVLVERVEGFATEAEWRRAYAEINDFEEQMLEHDIPVLKFWLHISNEEQLKRFEAREQTPYKKYKITEEDYRNRDKWNAYVEAVNEMVVETSTDDAPWNLISANDKRNARIEVLKTVTRAVEKLVD